MVGPACISLLQKKGTSSCFMHWAKCFGTNVSLLAKSYDHHLTQRVGWGENPTEDAKSAKPKLPKPLKLPVHLSKWDRRASKVDASVSLSMR